MNLKGTLIGLSAGILLAASPATADEARTADLVNGDGQRIGQVIVKPVSGGVLLTAKAQRLPAGAHGFHIHETGKCEPGEGFKTAGGHLADGASHGFHVDGGPHPGDMPNVHVGSDGVLNVEVLNSRVQLTESGDGALLDRDGSALMIHSGPDDYESQPSGAAGARIACAVIAEGGS
jgi:Cu-Zn family superoxide dismutase